MSRTAIASMFRACLFSLLLAPLALAQPTVSVQPLGALAVEVDGERAALEPHRAAAYGDGFVILATLADRPFGAPNPLVVLALDAGGAVTGHRVLDSLGAVLGAPTRMQPFGAALVFAVHVNGVGAPVKIIALEGLEAREVLSVPTDTSSGVETTGSVDVGYGSRITSTGFRLTDAVPLAQDLFLVTGQSTQEVSVASSTDLAAGSLGEADRVSAPRAVLVNTRGESRPLAVEARGSHGEVMGAAANSGQILTVYWTGGDAYSSDATVAAAFDAQFGLTDGFSVERPSDRFAEVYPWGEGFLLYGARGSDTARGDGGPSRLTLTVVGGRPASGARSAQDVDIGQDLPREGAALWFQPAFVGTLDGQGVLAVAALARLGENGAVESRRAYLGRLGNGPADRWELTTGTEAYDVRPLALHPGGALLTAHQSEYGAPWRLELARLSD